MEKDVETLVNEIKDSLKIEVRSMFELEKADMEKREAAKGVKGFSADKAKQYRDVQNALMEKRAITVNSGSSGAVLDDVMAAMIDGGKLVNKVTIFDSNVASALVPIFAPTLALPVGSAEGATSITADSTAVLGARTLALKPWYSILGVSRGALEFTAIERRLPGIFAEAFSGSIDKAIIAGTGSGNDSLGVFVASASGVPVAQDINCAATGAPKWADIIKLVTQFAASNPLSNDQYAMVINPILMAGVLSDTTVGTDPFRNEYLINGTVRGVKVIESSYAPSATAAGSYVAVVGYFKHYALAIAKELKIRPIEVSGSDNVMYNAFLYMAGSPAVGASFNRLKTV